MNPQTTTPTHIGLILDGHRRWAKAHNHTTLYGHRAGYKNLKDIAKYSFNKGISYVSAYIFSTENWDRTKREVNYLMNLAYRLVTTELDELNRDNIRLLWLGSSDRLSKKLINAIKKAETLTENNTHGTLCICFNYGGRNEIVEAFRKITAEGVSPGKINSKLINDNIYASNIPAIDLVIRTSGEQRISGFMLWRVDYAELIFLEKHWPEFNHQDLDNAIEEYSTRVRRYGK